MADADRPELPSGGGSARARAPKSLRSTPEILEDIAGNIQEIVRSEIRLATIEMRQKLAEAATGGIALAAGALTALYALGFLLVAVYHALAYAVWPWLAAAIIALALGLGAGAMIAEGRKRFRQFDPKPEKTLESVREDIAWIQSRRR